MSKIKVTTPKGTLQWAFINGAGKENLNGDMQYTVDLVTSREEAAPLIKQLEDLWEESKPKTARQAKSMGYKEAKEDPDSIVFTFKTKTTYPSGDPKRVDVFNAQAQKINFPDDKKIGNGSIGRVSGMAAIYDAGKLGAGVTLYLNAVQLIKLIEYAGGSGDFAAEDGGFEGYGDFNVEDLV